jgi:hypothetical protein
MSITLTSPYLVSIGGVQVEGDTVAACTGYSIDYIGHIMTYKFSIGTLAGSPPQFVAGPYAVNNGYQQITLTVNLATGAWSSNYGGAGTVPGSILNPIITQLLGNRNSSESFMAVAGGLMPGTQVPWTAL